MNISVGSLPVLPEKGQGAVLSVFSSQEIGSKPANSLPAFDVPRRRFGENFDGSTHAAVIKLMMMTFGQHPAGMFNEVVAVGDGYRITMKDEFKVHLSLQELEQAAKASRFEGGDPGVIKDANFVFAAFVKRKQVTAGYSSFDACLAKTLEGETTQRCLQGMGVFGLSQVVSSDKLTANGAMGVIETHNFGSALVAQGVSHVYGEQHKVDERKYGYVLFNDKPAPSRDARPVTHRASGAAPAQIWSGFYQGVEGNCVTVSAIKAAIIRFWKDPQGIYKQIQVTPNGFDIVMRDSFRLQLTHEEIRQAVTASNFYGTDPKLLDYANFLYAVSAKRAQLENNDFRGGQSYGVALETLNDGEHPGEALRRLGLYGYLRESTVKELAEGAIGTLADSHHSVAVIDGALDFYGQKQALASSRWMSAGLRALKLV